MLRSYISIALRNLAGNRLYSAISISGLAFGIAACILIALYVRHELSVDRWIPNGERIYRLGSRWDIPGRQPLIGCFSPGPAMEALKKDFNEIEAATRLLYRWPTVKRGADVFFQRMVLVDREFFTVFDIPLRAGERDTALADTSSVLLSEETAQRFFGQEDPLGQVLTIDDDVGKREFRVTGVLPDLRSNTHLDLPMIGLFDAKEFAEQPWVADQWTSANVLTYLKLKKGADAGQLAAALPAFEERNVPNANLAGQEVATHEYVQLSLRPLLDIHLRSGDEGGQIKAVGSMTSVITFAAVAVLILLIACINFVNLATARASKRAREVALRKVVGASRRQLMVQFLGESVLVALFALIVALAIVELALPTYAEFVGRELHLSYVGAESILPWLLVLLVVVGVAAGLYPALYVSRFRPAWVLKSNRSADTLGSSRLRAILVTAQFTVSIALMVCTAVVWGQAYYAKHKDLGFNAEGMLVVRGVGRENSKHSREVFAQEVRKLPGVTAVTFSSEVPGDSNENNSGITVPGQEGGSPILLGVLTVDYDFFDTYQILTLAGRTFSRERAQDDATERDVAQPYSIVVNELASKRLGFLKPEDAIGKLVQTGALDELAPAEIVGVISDFHYKSVRAEIRPTFYRCKQNLFFDLSVRYEGVAGPAVMADLEKTWRRLVPEVPFRGEYLDEVLAAQYQDEDALAAMLGAFAALAILVACLGLYGLAAFMAHNRTKEIGIRKALGASVRDIVRLLGWQFSKPALLANLIAWPIAWYAMTQWLARFQYRIDLHIAIFVTAGGLALLIAWLTVGGHAARVARTNPGHALRYE